MCEPAVAFAAIVHAAFAPAALAAQTAMDTEEPINQFAPPATIRKNVDTMQTDCIVKLVACILLQSLSCQMCEPSVAFAAVVHAAFAVAALAAQTAMDTQQPINLHHLQQFA